VEVANKKRSRSLLESGTGHDLTVEHLLFVVTIALVDNRDEVRVASVTKASGTIFQVTVAPTDVGKIIGKDGRMAMSIRTLLSAIGVAAKTRYRLKSSQGAEPAHVHRRLTGEK
jgi:predicted RNA-binding protein YlqC (UPF0109 family)